MYCYLRHSGKQKHVLNLFLYWKNRQAFFWFKNQVLKQIERRIQLKNAVHIKILNKSILISDTVDFHRADNEC